MKQFTDTKINGRLLVREFKLFAETLIPQLFVTMCPNINRHRKRAMKKLLKLMDAMCNKAIFGRNYYKLPTSERITGVAVLEHIHSNTHWHVVLNIGHNLSTLEFRRRELALRKALTKFSSRYLKSGDIDIRPIETKRVFDYISKELGNSENWDYFETIPVS